jgi:dihydroxy-acid dehydratase
VVVDIDRPLKPRGGFGILYGNLAPEGCVAKLAGHGEFKFQGPARVFESEDDCFRAVQARRINAGEVIVIRNEGPRGGPGMREMLAVTAATYGFMEGHVAPEAARRGPIGLLRDGDTISIDVDARRIDTDADLAARRADWKPRPHAYASGALAKYAYLVSSASEGAVTAFPNLDGQGLDP